MIINGVTIDDTFAEAFGMRGTRVIITAQNLKWAYNAANAMTGFATSVIACGVEAGIEREMDPAETPDGRPGVSVLLFAMGSAVLMKQLETRMGQCVLTCPTAAAFSGIEGGDRINLGKNLRFFGDGFQISKQFGGKRYWRVPVMDESQPQALAACEAAIVAMKKIPNVIMPFPGGVVRSGSKVGSKYKTLIASTNDAFCPTLKGITKTDLSPEIESVMEIVIDGLTDVDIRKATRAGIAAVCELGAANGIKRISAGNYGGKLGQFQFHLREIMSGEAA